MANTNASFNVEDDQLVRELFKVNQRNKRLVSSSTYSAPAVPDMTIRSWKMNEHKYYDVPSPFPTLARGLFTTIVGQSGAPPPAEAAEKGEEDVNVKYKIVARGYDKFFNIGEVPWTKWDTLEAHTSGPYFLTLKSNGCIIFIAALSPSKLLVTSKHSIGPVQNAEISHAQMGEKWLLRHLEAAGKTSEQLAKELWEKKLTAVAELCDDSFEEHVLAYSKEKTGLHLHGLNECTGAFRTLGCDVVSQFAREWGFIETAYHVEQSIAGVRRFADEVEESKKWNGEAIEGFVVRCHVSSTAHTGNDRKSAPPYPAGSSFFFKIKYDEPYMMYRDWRELTKTLLNAKGTLNEVSLNRNKTRRRETKLYVEWVCKEITRDRKQFDQYTKGKGIIATRDRFLAYMATKDGQNRAKEISVDAVTDQMYVNSLEQKSRLTFGKTMIVPIAVPGVGKTMVSVALKTLFGFGHIQSDDIRAKKAAPVFVQKVVDELKKYDVVIADRNNHLHKHRKELREGVEGFHPPVRMLALHWGLQNQPHATIHRICSDRILQRGDNHQTLRADAEAKKHEEVVWMFLEQTEDIGDKEVDEVVDMEIEADFEINLAKAIDACVRVLGFRKPTQEQVGQAMAVARGYAPTSKKEDEVKKGKVKGPRYYALLPEIGLTNIVDERLGKPDAPQSAGLFWDTLKDAKRVTAVPHITLVHNKSLPQEQALWDSCRDLFLSPDSPSFNFRVSHLVYNSRVMSLVVDDLKAGTSPGSDVIDKAAQEFVTKFYHPKLKGALHITVGTKDASIPALEGKSVVEDWRKGKPGITALALKGVVGKGMIKGLFS